MRLLLPSILTIGLGFASALSLPKRGDTRKRAAYLLSNNGGGDNVLALSISVDDGTVSNPVLTFTGGNGLLGNTANGTAVPDGLFGQGAVIVSQDVSNNCSYSTATWYRQYSFPALSLILISIYSLSIPAATRSRCSRSHPPTRFILPSLVNHAIL